MAQVGHFTQPDHSGNPRYFIEFLEMVESFPEIALIRARTFDQLRVGAGAKVLDVGCGIGTTASWIAERTGAACGVDISEAMVNEARLRAAHRSDIEFTQGGACELPYGDATFDAARMERVLLYVPDRLKAIREMMRVTKPGGRICITDIDAESTAIHSKDRVLTRKMKALMADSLVNPNSGPELPSLLRAAGLEDVTIDLMALPTNFEFCRFVMGGALEAAAEAGKVSRAEIDEWFGGLRELHEAGNFLQLWYFVIVGGTVPAA